MLSRLYRLSPAHNSGAWSRLSFNLRAPLHSSRFSQLVDFSGRAVRTNRIWSRSLLLIFISRPTYFGRKPTASFQWLTNFNILNLRRRHEPSDCSFSIHIFTQKMAAVQCGLMPSNIESSYEALSYTRGIPDTLGLDISTIATSMCAKICEDNGIKYREYRAF